MTSAARSADKAARRQHERARPWYALLKLRSACDGSRERGGEVVVAHPRTRADDGVSVLQATARQ